MPFGHESIALARWTGSNGAHPLLGGMAHSFRGSSSPFWSGPTVYYFHSTEGVFNSSTVRFSEYQYPCTQNIYPLYPVLILRQKIKWARESYDVQYILLLVQFSNICNLFVSWKKSAIMPIEIELDSSETQSRLTYNLLSMRKSASCRVYDFIASSLEVFVSDKWATPSRAKFLFV